MDEAVLNGAVVADGEPIVVVDPGTDRLDVAVEVVAAQSPQKELHRVADGDAFHSMTSPVIQ